MGIMTFNTIEEFMGFFVKKMIVLFFFDDLYDGYIYGVEQNLDPGCIFFMAYRAELPR